jgi:pSer/pThr/pTyr-binding forkhead associated (FHA) protein
VVDPSLNKDPDPASPCPIGAPDRVFHLDLEENTLGRQYEGNGIHPEIVVQDPGISRRHLKFIRDASGQFTVLELGSANGTEFNAKTLEVGVMTIVKPGDQLTLGMWTRVHVLAR